MTSATTQTKAITKSTDATLDGELSKVGITAMFIAGGLIGVWGIVCLVSGLVQSGGPLSFIGTWMSAVIGG